MTDRINHWRTLRYHDPAEILVRLRQYELQLSPDLSPRLARLRTGDLKRPREGRDAALFTYGMSLASDKRISYALEEREDYDFVTCWEEHGQLNFTPVQLKELVPEDLNPSASLPKLLASLSKNTHPTSTVLAIRLNRTARLEDLLAIPLPPLPHREVWYFCCLSPDASRWALIGDAKTELKWLQFDYPSGEASA